MAYPAQWRIEIDPQLEPKTEMDIALHEGLHCLFPEIPEEKVNDAGKTLADLLWRLGFRREREDD